MMGLSTTHWVSLRGTTEMQIADVVLAPLGGKERPAVLLRLEEKRAWVIAGTGTHRPHFPHVGVFERSREGLVLKLDKDTFFYANQLAILPLADVSAAPQGGRCPPYLLQELARLTEEQSQGRCFLCKTG